MSMIATREAYGQAIVDLGRTNPKIVVLDGDLSKATLTKEFGATYPERFFNMGIAEANLIGVAAGLASTGLIPFASTFAVFAAGRAYDQVRQSVAYAGNNVKIAGSHGGLTDGQDGATHQMLEDLALMRALPNMTVVVPADAGETREVVLWAAEYDGPVYIRLCREKGPEVNPEGNRFQLGQAVKLRDGQEIALLATGYMVATALEAAEILTHEGVSTAVYNFSSIKPLDESAVLEAAAKNKLIVTMEDHSIVGGLGGAVAEVLASQGAATPLLRLGSQDSFGTSGPADEVLIKYGLDRTGILRQVRAKWHQVKERF